MGERGPWAEIVSCFPPVWLVPAGSSLLRRPAATARAAANPGWRPVRRRRPAGRNGPDLSTRCPPAVIVPAVDHRTVDSGARAPAHVDHRPRAAGLGPTTTDPRAARIRRGGFSMAVATHPIRATAPAGWSRHPRGPHSRCGTPKARPRLRLRPRPRLRLRLRRQGAYGGRPWGGGSPCCYGSSARAPALLAASTRVPRMRWARAWFGVRRLLLISKRSTLTPLTSATTRSRHEPSLPQIAGDHLGIRCRRRHSPPMAFEQKFDRDPTGSSSNFVNQQTL
ncbi:hypothetical protein Ga0074812_1562 [Parafrankia irregularis]|uniref:Uncharacterized protein n=1 Tax=Parafrankia irregularis TaxID=795642 RepID=A0A0S4R044_9ACTN|nr:hypothetical protein Ga0074812_1562 [Parafrankia irregularis]